MEIQLRECTRALQSTEDFVLRGCDPDTPRYQVSCCGGAFLSQADTADPWLSILSGAEVPSDEGLYQSFPSLYLHWIRSVYGFALVLTELFFSLIKHISVCLFVICYAYKSFKSYVRSYVVLKLPGCALPELLEGPYLMHSLSSSTMNIIFPVCFRLF